MVFYSYIYCTSISYYISLKKDTSKKIILQKGMIDKVFLVSLGILVLTPNLAFSAKENEYENQCIHEKEKLIAWKSWESNHPKQKGTKWIQGPM